MTVTMKTLGQIAYEAHWAVAARGLVSHPSPTPDWSEL